jgi:hypothetical protein
MPIQISVINSSTVLTDQQVSDVVPVLQKQVTQDFYPIWGVDAKLTFVPSAGDPDTSSWWLVILDDSDQANALGYHDITSEGLPLGKVFAGSDMKFGSNWTVTASHELLEMLGDPDINLTAFVQTSDTAGTLYAYEVCDACEADQYAYKVDGVEVSDFVYPSWFESFRKKNSTQFDQQNKITQPFQLLTGGYIGVFDISAGSGWHSLMGEKTLASVFSRGTVGSRRERRRVLRKNWVPSSAHSEIRRKRKEYRTRLTKALGRAA